MIDFLVVFSAWKLNEILVISIFIEDLVDGLSDVGGRVDDLWILFVLGLFIESW